MRGSVPEHLAQFKTSVGTYTGEDFRTILEIHIISN
jgi:hypothetical protein